MKMGLSCLYLKSTATILTGTLLFEATQGFPKRYSTLSKLKFGGWKKNLTFCRDVVMFLSMEGPNKWAHGQTWGLNHTFTIH